MRWIRLKRRQKARKGSEFLNKRQVGGEYETKAVLYLEQQGLKILERNFNFFNYGIGQSYQKLKRITPYITAGLGFMYWNVDGKSNFSVNIPLGVGLKYKLSKRINLGFEFLMKKCFSDKLDGTNLQDPYMIQSSFMKNTDWYSTMTFTISYEFSERCAVCHYKE